MPQKIASDNGTQRAPVDYSQENRWHEAEVRVDKPAKWMAAVDTTGFHPERFVPS